MEEDKHRRQSSSRAMTMVTGSYGGAEGWRRARRVKWLEVAEEARDVSYVGDKSGRERRERGSGERMEESE